MFARTPLGPWMRRDNAQHRLLCWLRPDRPRSTNTKWAKESCAKCHGHWSPAVKAQHFPKTRSLTTWTGELCDMSSQKHVPSEPLIQSPRAWGRNPEPIMMGSSAPTQITPSTYLQHFFMPRTHNDTVNADVRVQELTTITPKWNRKPSLKTMSCCCCCWGPPGSQQQDHPQMLSLSLQASSHHLRAKHALQKLQSFQTTLTRNLWARMMTIWNKTGTPPQTCPQKQLRMMLV